MELSLQCANGICKSQNRLFGGNSNQRQQVLINECGFLKSLRRVADILEKKF